MKFKVLFLCLSLSAMLGAQDLDKLADTYARKHFNSFKQLLSIPNDGHFPDQVEQNVVWCERATHDRICRFNSTTSYLAFRTDFDSDIGRWLTSALTNTFGSEPIRHRTSGGSIPISPFVTTLNIPAVTVPTVNRDNNQHSPNENLRLGNYVDGIKTMIGILIEPLGADH